MAGATFARIKNWAAAETLLRADLNAEFDNILSNMLPAGMDDYSVNAAQMKLQIDPGAVGTESLPTSLAGEIERLRFAIKRIAGETYWYTAPDSSISELAAAVGSGLLGNRIASGRSSADSSQALFLVPNGAARTVSVQGATTNLVYYINSVQYTISTAVTSGLLTLAPSSNNTCLVNDPTLSGSLTHSKQMGECGTEITVDAMGSEITALVGKYAAFSVGATEYFIAKVESSTRLTQVMRGGFFSSADAKFPRLVINDNDTITLMKLTWVYATTTGTIAVSYTNPRIGGDEPSSPAVGDYWYDLTNQTWKIFDSSSFISAGATLVGICLQNTTVTIAARSFDFFKNHNALNTIELERISNTEVRGKKLNSEVVVYGTTLKFNYDWPRWDITLNRDSGVSETASTTYYCYLKENGDSLISDVAPHDRKDELKGFYHPHETWRCVGSFFNDASSNITAANDFAYNPEKYSISASVATSALTVMLLDETGNVPTHTFPLVVYFRSATAATGLPIKRIVYNPQTIVVPSTATMGHRDAVSSALWVGLVDNASVPEIFISSVRMPDTTILGATVAIGTGSDSSVVVYTNTLRTNVPIITMGRMLSTQTTAGTWAAVPTEIAVTNLPAEIITAVYESDAQQSITNSGALVIIDFEDINSGFTTHPEAVTVGASWKFTAPRAGIINLSSFVAFNGLAATAGNVMGLAVHVDGTILGYLDYRSLDLSNSLTYGLSGAMTFKVSAASYVDLRISYNRTSGASTLNSNADVVRVSISLT